MPSDGCAAVLHTAYLVASKLHATVPGAVKLDAVTAPVAASRMYGASGDAKLTQSCVPTMASAGGLIAADVAVSTTGDVGVHTDAPRGNGAGVTAVPDAAAVTATVTAAVSAAVAAASTTAA